MLKIRKRMGIPESKNSGIDTLEQCLDKDHFLSYTKDISYRYNSRGFRDHEWPEDLSDVVWCVGDSFTVGIGQPFEETWPQVLEKRIGKRCINLGEDGCSNDTMALRVKEIARKHNPTLIIVMWSYFSRRRVENENAHFQKSDFGHALDLENFHKNFNKVNSLPPKIINLLIPNAFIDIDKVSTSTLNYSLKKFKFNPEQIKSILTFKQLDFARDGLHFDFKTSNAVCDLIKKSFNLDNKSKYPI